MSDKPSRTEMMRSITAADFGRRVAEAFLESSSSTAVFFIQQALKDSEDDVGLYWEEFRDMLTRFSAEQPR